MGREYGHHPATAACVAVERLSRLRQLQKLVLMIKYELGMETAAEASSGTEAIAQFRQHSPDVTLMDLRLGDMNGVDVIATIRQEFFNARIIILTTYDTDEDIYRGLKIGAKPIFEPSAVGKVTNTMSSFLRAGVLNPVDSVVGFVGD